MRYHRIPAAAAAALAALSLAACSSSSSTETSTTPAPAASSAVASSPAASTPAAAGTIVEVAAANADFSTLVAAVKAAGLVDTLNGAGPFTVFAPTNEAFAALPAGLVDKLLLPANKATLTKILTYHVLPAEVMAADVKAGMVKTVEGGEITITTDGGVKVNEAGVTATDVDASNGVIHVIDKVLVPADVDVSKL
ncbi:MAG: fasciclin domain-containing protein [Kineosporiaceae bacterium]|nr:fasciclin domain-containing protein [Kineosporiaceae bacterium]MBK7623241.1 fasciclin domain-containing protein [Kineosporiaceae bacterium]MBK8074807.1 fasciclin domain-containing protein [Kineosporiaceae bacterium]